jgi:hypothetical protein
MRSAWQLAPWVIAPALFLLSCGDDTNSPSGGGSSSGASGNDGSSSSGEPVVGTGESFGELCWSTINEYRTKDGLPPYARWTDAETCSDGEARDDARTGRGHGSFPRCGELAQNECPDTPGAPEEALTRCLSAMWGEGPGGGHHDAMASREYTKVACGVFVTSKKTIWSVQNFR